MDTFMQILNDNWLPVLVIIIVWFIISRIELLLRSKL